MRLTALLAGLLVAGFVFAADGQSAHAQTQTTNEPKQVVVESGDTLTKIAQKFQTVYTRIFDANPKVADPDLIYPGDELRIPSPEEELASRTQPSNQPTARVQSASKPSKAPSRAPSKTQPAVAPVTAPSGDVWDRLAKCESGGNWAINTGNGYYGGLQFTIGSWQAVGGSGYPHQASKSEQITRGQMLQARQGWGAWPACTAKLGIR